MAECRGSGRHVLSPTIPDGTPVYPVKSMCPPRRRWYCALCGRTAMARLTGQRGGWWYEFETHPARGVTKRQWAERAQP